MKKVILFISLSCILFASCGKKEKETLVDPSSGKQITMNVNRFEDIIFAQNQKDYKAFLQANYEAYKPLFKTTLDNPPYFEMVKDFASDPVLISAYKIVKKRYPNLNWVSNGVTSAFANLLKEYPKTKIPKLYSMMFGPAEFSYSYASRVIAQKDFIAFSIDLYSINILPDYQKYAQFPKYMITILDSAYIVPDIMNTYLRNVTTYNIPLMEENPEASLCDIIVERGKYLYAVKQLLPDCSMSSIFRYTKEQMEWTEKSEYGIWGYIIQNNLLYSNERTKYMHLINDGPTTKGINGSPSRLGDYIGYKIVEKYMKENKKSLKELLETKDAKEILRKSGYKPKK